MLIMLTDSPSCYIPRTALCTLSREIKCSSERCVSVTPVHSHFFLQRLVSFFSYMLFWHEVFSFSGFHSLFFFFFLLNHHLQTELIFLFYSPDVIKIKRSSTLQNLVERFLLEVYRWCFFFFFFTDILDKTGIINTSYVTEVS